MTSRELTVADIKDHLAEEVARIEELLTRVPQGASRRSGIECRQAVLAGHLRWIENQQRGYVNHRTTANT